MCTAKKPKWLVLVSIGLLIVVIQNLIEYSGSWHIPDFVKGIVMGTGIGIELIGLVLVRRNSCQNL